MWCIATALMFVELLRFTFFTCECETCNGTFSPLTIHNSFEEDDFHSDEIFLSLFFYKINKYINVCMCMRSCVWFECIVNVFLVLLAFSVVALVFIPTVRIKCKGSAKFSTLRKMVQ